MSNRKSHYKKKSNIPTSVLSTMKIILTVALAAAIVMIGFFVIRDGWKAVIDWFSSSWACMFGLVLLVGATATLWIISIYKKLKVVSEDEK